MFGASDLWKSIMQAETRLRCCLHSFFMLVCVCGSVCEKHLLITNRAAQHNGILHYLELKLPKSRARVEESRGCIHHPSSSVVAAVAQVSAHRYFPLCVCACVWSIPKCTWSCKSHLKWHSMSVPRLEQSRASSCLSSAAPAAAGEVHV